MALCKITEERYQYMYHTLEEEEQELKQTAEMLKTELEQTNEIFQNVESFIPLIQKYTDIQELNASILNALIEKIMVHEKVVDEYGNKTQKIEIYYKFVGIVGMGGA